MSAEVYGGTGGGRWGHGRTCGTHDPLDLLHVLQLWAEAPVHAEDLLVHDGGHGQAVEAVRERLPQLDVVPPLAWPSKGA